MEAKAAEKVVILTGRVEPVIHQVETEETTRHQRSRTGKSNQRGSLPNREMREGFVVRRMALVCALASPDSRCGDRGVSPGLNHFCLI